jgi:deoxyxylulose-5-phosphate synthase
VINGGLGAILKQHLFDHDIEFLNFGIQDKFIDAGDKQKCLKDAAINSEKIIFTLNKKNEKKN